MLLANTTRVSCRGTYQPWRGKYNPLYESLGHLDNRHLDAIIADFYYCDIIMILHYTFHLPSLLSIQTPEAN